MEKSRDKQKLAEIARRARQHIVKMVYLAKSGHPGGALGSAEIVTALYFAEMNHRPDEPDWPDRDRFVLSKGHICALHYAILALAGYFPEDVLPTFRKLGSPLQGHPDMRKTVGVELSTGALGLGLSVGNGMALAGKLDGKSYRVYGLLGDGETQEGQIWEAALSAPHYKLDNLCFFTDYNDLQIDGHVHEVKGIAPLREKWEAFGWHALEIDGHDYDQIFAALDAARATQGRPTMIVARTVKGKGVSYMEGDVEFHGKAPNDKEYAQAVKELGIPE